MVNQQQIQGWLSQGVQAFNRNDFVSAEQVFRGILQHAPGEPTALYFLGGIRRKQRRNDEARQFWQQSLGTRRAQPQTLNALANLDKEEGRFDDAVAGYREALTHSPDYGEAWFNLGLAYQVMRQPEEALGPLEKACALLTGNVPCQNAYGQALRDAGQVEKAINVFEALLIANPNYVKGWHNLAIARRVQFQHEDALVACRKAIALAPKLAEFRYLEGNICFELGNFDEADVAYRTALALKPDYVEVHVSINKLYWEFKKDDLLGKSFEVGIKHNPVSVSLWMGYVTALEKAERFQEAETVRARAKEYIGKQPEFLQSQAAAHVRLGKMDHARDVFETAVACDEERKATRLAYAQFLIKEAEYDRALVHLDKAGELAPLDQEVWTYRGLCWQLMGDERASWLNDFERFVQPIRIGTPKGYSSFNEFLDELKPVIRSLHFSLQHPIDQTLRGGSQTFGKLFDRPHPLIQKLKKSLHEAVATYIEGLPDDETHPLLSRKSENFDFATSWSVWLKQSGFHVNHMHSMGWVSSSFYLELPENSEEEDANHEGWIKFGESNLGLGKREEIGRIIKPEVGTLVLFPSYMWHGTVPFSREADRITTPFDIVPLP